MYVQTLKKNESICFSIFAAQEGVCTVALLTEAVLYKAHRLYTGRVIDLMFHPTHHSLPEITLVIAWCVTFQIFLLVPVNI